MPTVRGRAPVDAPFWQQAGRERERDCCGHRGRRPFGPDTPKRASSKIAPGDFVEPNSTMFEGSNPSLLRAWTWGGPTPGSGVVPP